LSGVATISRRLIRKFQNVSLSCATVQRQRDVIAANLTNLVETARKGILIVPEYDDSI